MKLRTNEVGDVARRTRRLGKRSRVIAPRCRRSPRRGWTGVETAWRELVLSMLELAEREVVESPEERAQVQTVQRLAAAQFARQPLPPFDPQHLAFTIGLVATLVESKVSSPGLTSVGVELLSPSALVEYERAARCVRASHRRGGERKKRS